MLPLAKQSLDEAPYKLSGAVAKLAGITFSRLAFSYWIDNLGFITKGKLAAISSNLLLGFPTGRSFTSSTTRQQVLWHYSSPRHHQSTLKYFIHIIQANIDQINKNQYCNLGESIFLGFPRFGDLSPNMQIPMGQRKEK
jgi:hypothetical protein